MERKTKLWEDRPAHLIRSGKTQDLLEQEALDSDMARRYFWCEHCGVEKGELCKSSDTDNLSETERLWHEEWDTHDCRTQRWLQATELERAMLRASDEEE